MELDSNLYTPSTIGEIMDLLGSMMLGAPPFEDKTGYFPDRSITSEFPSLNAGLEVVRKKIGEENYAKLIAISARMQDHFRAGIRGNPEETSNGCKCIWEMEDILRARQPPQAQRIR